MRWTHLLTQSTSSICGHVGTGLMSSSEMFSSFLKVHQPPSVFTSLCKAIYSHASSSAPSFLWIWHLGRFTPTPLFRGGDFQQNSIIYNPRSERGKAEGADGVVWVGLLWSEVPVFSFTDKLRNPQEHLCALWQSFHYFNVKWLDTNYSWLQLIFTDDSVFPSGVKCCWGTFTTNASWSTWGSRCSIKVAYESGKGLRSDSRRLRTKTKTNPHSKDRSQLSDMRVSQVLQLIQVYFTSFSPFQSKKLPLRTVQVVECSRMGRRTGRRRWQTTTDTERGTEAETSTSMK